jgi:hypothetical protein
MLPPPLSDQRVLVGLLGLCVMLPDVWPRHAAVSPPPPRQPGPPQWQRQRCQEPTPVVGLPHRPPCALGAPATTQPAPPPPRRPAPMAPPWRPSSRSSRGRAGRASPRVWSGSTCTAASARGGGRAAGHHAVPGRGRLAAAAGGGPRLPPLWPAPYALAPAVAGCRGAHRQGLGAGGAVVDAGEGGRRDRPRVDAARRAALARPTVGATPGRVKRGGPGGA